MAPKQRMRAANQINEKKVLKRGSVPVSLVSRLNTSLNYRNLVNFYVPSMAKNFTRCDKSRDL